MGLTDGMISYENFLEIVKKIYWHVKSNPDPELVEVREFLNDEYQSDIFMIRTMQRNAMEMLYQGEDPVAYWRGLLDKYGDLGGCCQAGGITVRTPWVAPPTCWSTS